ncbi:insulinase family protein [Arthrobacter sp. NPDC056493]|uniref:insulinase family protein n=1 Tax=Arthrobacter sp. NPDC056493 TaxID=3345839 RepID=UPI00366B2541
MMQTVHTTSHNRITSFWLDRDGLCTGTLIFGVGMRDEPPTLAGITHLLEHVLLRLVQPVTILHGGTVTTDSLQFYAVGKPDDVAGFLNAIAAAVSTFRELTDEVTALEKSVLEAEDPHKFSNVSSGLLTYRYGTSGVGAAQFGAPATTGLTKAELIEWACRWLVAGNTALTFTGPVPSALDIRLPAGGAVSHHQDPPLITTPTVIKSRKQGVALSLLAPSQDADLLCEALRYELLARLRHEAGIIYSVENFTTAINNDQSQLDLILDPVRQNTVPAFKESINTLRGIVDAGFSEDAVQSARHALTAELGWDDYVPQDYLDQLAINALLGRSTRDRQELLDRAPAITSAELTTILRTSIGSLIVAVDKSVKLFKADAGSLGLAMDRYEIWQRTKEAKNRQSPVEGQHGNTTWRHKSSPTTLVLTSTHLISQNSGKTKTISLADLTVVEDRSCGCISLIDQRGRSSDLNMDEWKAGKKLRKQLIDAFPPEIIRPFPEE